MSVILLQYCRYITMFKSSISADGFWGQDRWRMSWRPHIRTGPFITSPQNNLNPIISAYHQKQTEQTPHCNRSHSSFFFCTTYHIYFNEYILEAGRISTRYTDSLQVLVFSVYYKQWMWQMKVFYLPTVWLASCRIRLNCFFIFLQFVR